MSEEKAGDVQWIQDSGGVTSCHVNDGKFNFEDSLIGRLDYRTDGWHVILKDKTDLAPNGLPSLSAAREAMVAHFSKAPRTFAAPVETPEEVKRNRMKPREAQAGKSWDEIKKR